MSKDDYLTEDEIAEFLRVKRSTLSKNRCLGKNHPPYIKIGGLILYPRKLFNKWLNDQPVQKEIKAG